MFERVLEDINIYWPLKIIFLALSLSCTKIFLVASKLISCKEINSFQNPQNEIFHWWEIMPRTQGSLHHICCMVRSVAGWCVQLSGEPLTCR
jgi:hypothetical protein